MKIQYYKNDSQKDIKTVPSTINSIRKDIEVLVPQCPEDCGQENCASCDFLQEERFTYNQLIGLVSEPYIVCFCNGNDGLSDPKTGHRPGCLLGEAGKKLRRRIEDRLRKNIADVVAIGKILGIE